MPCYLIPATSAVFIVTGPSKVLVSCFVVIVVTHDKVAGVLDVTEGVRRLSNNNNSYTKGSSYNSRSEILPTAPFKQMEKHIHKNKRNFVEG